MQIVKDRTFDLIVTGTGSAASTTALECSSAESHLLQSNSSQCIVFITTTLIAHLALNISKKN